jgi:hypothetical protein
VATSGGFWVAARDNIDPLGLWCFGDPLPNNVYNYSVGAADGLSFGAGALIRNATSLAGSVDTDSSAYAAGVYSGGAIQAGLGAGVAASISGVQSLAQSLYVSGQLLVGTANLTGAGSLPPAVEAIYDAGEVTAEQDIESAQQAIEAASTWVQTRVW